MMKVFLLFSLFSVALSQQLISLSNFHGDNAINELPLPAPYSIYISAIPDSANLLSNIFVMNDDGTQKSFNDLKNNRLGYYGELKRYVVQRSSYVTTSLTTNQMKTLRGVMFISTPNQVANNNFHVVDIGNSQNVQFQGLGAIDSTVLFLNTRVNTNPINSAVISNWQQRSDASAFLYAGFPMDSIEPKNTQIFSNPMHTDKFDKFFPTVEKFSVSMVAFYLKTYNGVNFRVDPGYYNIDKYTTSAYTTTGFYMKALDKQDNGVTITTKRDTRYSGSTGANIIGSLSTGAKVTVAEYGGRYDDLFSVPPNDFIVPWSTPNIGQLFSISSSPPGATGRYFVQYFVLQGPLTPATTPQSETTTKSSGTIQILISLMIPFMVFIGFY